MLSVGDFILISDDILCKVIRIRLDTKKYYALSVVGTKEVIFNKSETLEELISNCKIMKPEEI